MTAPDTRQPDEKWRIGTSWGIHVYQGEKGSPGERPVGTFHDPADAQRAVDAVNGADLHARVEAVAEELEADARAAQGRADGMDRTEENARHHAAERRHAHVAHQAASALRAALATGDPA